MPKHMHMVIYELIVDRSPIIVNLYVRRGGTYIHIYNASRKHQTYPDCGRPTSIFDIIAGRGVMFLFLSGVSHVDEVCSKQL